MDTENSLSMHFVMSEEWQQIGDKFLQYITVADTSLYYK